MIMRLGYKLTRSISDRALINVAGSHPHTLSDRSAPRGLQVRTSSRPTVFGSLIINTEYLYELGVGRLSLVNRFFNSASRGASPVAAALMARRAHHRRMVLRCPRQIDPTGKSILIFRNHVKPKNKNISLSPTGKSVV
jgi:hypothetical protein